MVGGEIAPRRTDGRLQQVEQAIGAGARARDTRFTEGEHAAARHQQFIQSFSLAHLDLEDVFDGDQRASPIVELPEQTVA